MLGWFHQADRTIHRVTPRLNPSLTEFGVFGLRAFCRPNPIGLTVARIESIEEGAIVVSDLDFINGTPVLDIKPYYEPDIVFNPDGPYIRPQSREILEQTFMKQALSHHNESCQDLLIAVKMAMAAEAVLGKLSAKEVSVQVQGSRCLGDALQGISQARLANPPRFTYTEDALNTASVWTRGPQKVTITLKPEADLAAIEKALPEMLFTVRIDA